MTQPRYTAPPQTWTDEKEHLRKLAQILAQVQNGQTNNAFEVTLVPNATTTEVVAPRATTLSVVLLSPKSASAAEAVSSVWIQPSKGRITFHHDSKPAPDRTFGYTITA